MFTGMINTHYRILLYGYNSTNIVYVSAFCYKQFLRAADFCPTSWIVNGRLLQGIAETDVIVQDGIASRMHIRQNKSNSIQHCFHNVSVRRISLYNKNAGHKN